MTSPLSWASFSNIWVVDFEFTQPDGHRPAPVCCVARNLRTGDLLRLWAEDLARPTPPYGIGPQDLFVAYYASAECNCHLVLGWSMPTWVLDLYAEFRVLTNGHELPCGRRLLGACLYFKISAMEASEKDSMIDLAIRGGPYSSSERTALTDYCQADVDTTAKLFESMQAAIDLPRALLRGRYMAAAAKMEYVGIPVDVPTLTTLRESWDDVKGELIARVDRHYGVFEGTTFKVDLFERFLVAHNIPWDRTETGRLALDDDTFKERARMFPALHPLRELRHSLSQLRLADLPVGPDGRNRTMLSAFGTKTGRNAPSTSQFMFGPSTWLRHLIRPEPGRALAYLDWSSQEFGIAAALSGDDQMLAAYQSGDPYLWLAKQAGAVPPDATKYSHPEVRETFKVVTLAVGYGMGPDTLASRLGQSPAHATQLLRQHRVAYPLFWRWAERAIDYAMLTNRLHTVFGWTLHVGAQSNPRTLQNFPVQGSGADMLRLACCLTTEAGIRVCAPIHDALLIEAHDRELQDAIAQTEEAMAAASRAVLNGVTLRSSVTQIRYPQRFTDPRGAAMWATVLDVLAHHDRPMTAFQDSSTWA
jgi:hypothetical protein